MAAKPRSFTSILENWGGSYTLLASQFHPANPLLQLGDYRLMIAVLEQAFIDIDPRGTESGKTRYLRQETREWFSSSDKTFLYDFVTICETLGLCVDTVREYALLLLRTPHERLTFFRQEKRPSTPTERTKREEARERAERTYRKSRGQAP